MSFSLSTPSARQVRALPLIYWLLMAASCAAYAWRPLSGGDDFWAHAAVGRWMMENKTWPHQTLFLWGTTPIPWVYHSWLSQLSFYGLLACGETWGPILAIAGTSLIVTVTFSLLWRAWSTQLGGVSPIMILSFCIAIYCSRLRFHPRPELFSALFLCILLLYLSRVKGAPNARGVLGVGALFVAWANFHGGVAIGLTLLAATVAMEILQQRFSPVSLRWLWPLITAVLAICLNPYGLEYWNALKPVGGEMFSRIDEWKPFWKSPVLHYKWIASEFILVAVALLSWILNPEKRWAQGAWLVIMLTLFISARRHLWLLPITSLAVLVANAQSLSTRQLLQLFGWGEITFPHWSRNFSRAAMLGVLLLAVAFSIPPNILSSAPVAPKVPRAAAQFLWKSPAAVKTRVFSDYENSSFLQWRFGGRPPLYIDLLNAYPDQLLLDYLDIVHANERGRRLLDERKIGSVILPAFKANSTLAQLAAYLNESPQWQRIYQGRDGAIWTRRKRTASRRDLKL